MIRTEDHQISTRLKIQKAIPINPTTKTTKESSKSYKKILKLHKECGVNGYVKLTEFEVKKISRILHGVEDDDKKNYLLWLCWAVALLDRNLGRSWTNFYVFYNRVFDVFVYWGNVSIVEVEKEINKINDLMYGKTKRFDIKVSQCRRTRNFSFHTKGTPPVDEKYWGQFKKGYAIHHVKGNKTGEVEKLEINDHYLLHSLGRRNYDKKKKFKKYVKINLQC